MWSSIEKVVLPRTPGTREIEAGQLEGSVPQKRGGGNRGPELLLPYGCQTWAVGWKALNPPTGGAAEWSEAAWTTWAPPECPGLRDSHQTH